jgi:hypothetical protein
MWKCFLPVAGIYYALEYIDDRRFDVIEYMGIMIYHIAITLLGGVGIYFIICQ